MKHIWPNIKKTGKVKEIHRVKRKLCIELFYTIRTTICDTEKAIVVNIGRIVLILLAAIALNKKVIQTESVFIFWSRKVKFKCNRFLNFLFYYLNLTYKTAVLGCDY